MEEKDKKVLQRIENAISDIKNNNFTLYFFVIDSKNVPNGSLSYIYQMAYTLQEKGYNVKMLYQLENEYTENEIYQLNKKQAPIDYNRVFQGVGEWLGEEYAKLPHMNIATEEWKVSPADFLFIPEAFASLMYQTYKYKAPCKRFVILQNYDYIMDFLPLGVEWKNYGVYDMIATSETQSELVKGVFPYVKSRIIPPYIPTYFRKPLQAKKLLINIVAKNPDDVNRVIKPFYWKYPIYKFISFRDLRNFPRQKYAELMQEAAITVWIDEKSPFGYSALEAMRCNSIIIGKVPEVVPEWMNDNGNIKDNGFWTYDVKNIPDILAKVIYSWLQDKMPETILENMETTNQLYTYEEWSENIEKTFKEITEEQISSFKEAQTAVENKEENK